VSQFTIITPMYNAATTVAETIASVRLQTMNDWRMIVMDDGSSDASLDVANKAADNDPRIQVIANGRIGHIGTLRNRALRMAEARFVAFLDADDVWHPEFLERQRALACETNSTVVHSAAKHLIDGQAVDVPPRYRGPQICDPPTMLRYLCPTNPIYSPSVLLRYDTMMAIGAFSEHPDHFSVLDTDLWLRLAPKHRFAYNTAKLVSYRISTTSLSGNPKNLLRNFRGEIIALRNTLADSDEIPQALVRRLRYRLGRSQVAYSRLLMDAEPPELELARQNLFESLANGYVSLRHLPFQLLARVSPQWQYRLHRLARRIRAVPRGKYSQQATDHF
jgi:teichuronic acid biosynthesis glycosyltransferase TuaG